ncbi:hypothetical protein H1Z61_10950 [Bacillus aquiflavi]|uniref:Lipoprotein n=1 Tax=Bacillus aquiflavi TaxID=2672567 RepID=A0A6B3W1N6_9BACI|nr:hypothetical protein [Bacillus aquiflavi]MBA4537636.1 hypothetical protein [Bacillus aquiflavi]NEY81893.1 hypothetical protein [Bacillus aquiflavi]
MKHKKKILTFSVGMSLLLGGCFNMDNTNHKTNKAKNEQTKETPEEHPFLSNRSANRTFTRMPLSRLILMRKKC